MAFLQASASIAFGFNFSDSAQGRLARLIAGSVIGSRIEANVEHLDVVRVARLVKLNCAIDASARH